MSATKHPCGMCPFKKNSIKGYLGGFSLEDTLAVARSEQSFNCHKTRDTGAEKECSGRLLYATKICKSFRNPDLEELRLEAKENNSINDILGFDFKSHHDI